MEAQQTELQIIDLDKNTAPVGQAPIKRSFMQVSKQATIAASRNYPQQMKKSLDELFPEQAYEEKEIKRAKEALGALANQFTAEDLRGVVCEMQCLVESWLDDFEREIFKGLTLQELLHERGNK